MKMDFNYETLFEEIIEEVQPSERMLEAQLVVSELLSKPQVDEEKKERLNGTKGKVKTEKQSQEYMQAVEIIDGIVRGMTVVHLLSDLQLIGLEMVRKLIQLSMIVQRHTVVSPLRDDFFI